MQSRFPSNLVPGSEWLRQKKKGHSIVTVLHVTNTELSDAILENHPMQVVFCNDKFQVLSMTVDNFVQNRTYQGIDPIIENSVAQLFSVEDESDDDEDMDLLNLASLKDDIEIEDDDSEDDDSEDDDDSDDDSEDDDSDEIYSLDLVVGQHPSAVKLESSLVSYSEMPYHTGDTLHVLKFSTINGLTPDEAANAFIISQPNSIQQFSVGSPHHTTPIVVDVDSYVTTFYELLTYETLIVVYVLSAGERHSFGSKDVTTASSQPSQVSPAETGVTEKREQSLEVIVGMLENQGSSLAVDEKQSDKIMFDPSRSNLDVTVV